MRILIIESEQAISDSIEMLLSNKGFETEIINDTDSISELSDADLLLYNVLVIDAGVPGFNYHSFVKKVRQCYCSKPIIVLSAKSGAKARIEGLDSGADYLLSKPIDIMELFACINALLRRQSDYLGDNAFGNTHLELDTGLLVCGEKSVRLSSKEFDIMRFLLQSKQRNLSKEVILARVWGYNSSAVENHVEVYIGFLRKKLALIESDICIESVRRMGYHLGLKEN